jgi:thiamine-phosphate pyrophosphorylase
MLTGEFGAKLFINDRVDVAVAVEADGVHLGHQSMPPEAVRKIVGRRMLIGVSTHNLEEAFSAEKNGADFITFGPIFPTPSKMKYGAPVGTDIIVELKKNGHVPVFGLGGIKTENVREVLKAGTDGVAMISAIFAAADIQKATEEIAEKLST